MVDEYVDDGWSGTNFDRPAFQRMMEDVDAGKINCIVECTPMLGSTVMETAKKLKNGETVDQLIHPEERYFSDEQDLSNLEPRGY